MKTYVITLSKVFPILHPRAGEPTGFAESLFEGKLHTIRANYDLWRRRFDEIEAGKACLSVRQWTGKPYRSKQVELTRLTPKDGIGLQKLYFGGKDLTCPFVDGEMISTNDLARNDGLSLTDWCSWFHSYDLTTPLAIIHFTKFRYNRR